MNKTLTKIIIIIVMVLVLWGIWLVAPKKDSQNNGDDFSSSEELIIKSDDHILGNQSAPVFLVEYSDFQCPACKAYQPFLNNLKSDFPEDLAIVYRHFPLRRNHPNAAPAAFASESAGLQDKFWEMHDMIFENQEQWASNSTSDAEAVFTGYAQNLGLDLEKFKSDFSSDLVKERVGENEKEASSLNLGGTPTFFLNGKKINNPGSYEEFRQVVEDALSEIAQL